MSLKCSTIKETFICEWNLLSSHTCSQTPASQTESRRAKRRMSLGLRRVRQHRRKYQPLLYYFQPASQKASPSLAYRAFKSSKQQQTFFSTHSGWILTLEILCKSDVWLSWSAVIVTFILKNAMVANMWNNTDICFLHRDFLCIDAKFIHIFILALDLECDVIDLLYKKLTVQMTLCTHKYLFGIWSPPITLCLKVNKQKT